MTKLDVVKQIVLNTGIDRYEVLKVVEAFTEAVKTALREGNNVYLRGFGSFIVKKRAEKSARNMVLSQ